MASEAAQKGLKYEPVEKILDGGAERRGCNFWTSLSPDFSWADDLLHSWPAQTGRRSHLSPTRYTLEACSGSRGDALPRASAIGIRGDHRSVRVRASRRPRPVHASERSSAHR